MKIIVVIPGVDTDGVSPEQITEDFSRGFGTPCEYLGTFKTLEVPEKGLEAGRPDLFVTIEAESERALEREFALLFLTSGGSLKLHCFNSLVKKDPKVFEAYRSEDLLSIGIVPKYI